MGAQSQGKPSDDDLIKCFENIKFPSGDLDDLIFGRVELKPAQKLGNDGV
ncbi:MAG: hypothetical protein IKY44_06375 [Clostridia bacterium]|nr:hypothetical protein [Clostridia bacterium]